MVPCMRMRTLRHPTEDLRIAILSMMKPVPRPKSEPDDQLVTFPSVYAPSCTAVMLSLSQAVAAMTRFRVKDAIPSQQKRTETIRAYPVRGIVLVSDAVSSKVTWRGGFVFRSCRLLDVTRSLNFKQELVNKCSSDDIELFSSSIQWHE